MVKRLSFVGVLWIVLSVFCLACGGGADKPAQDKGHSSPPPPATSVPATQSDTKKDVSQPKASQGQGRIVEVINGDVGGPTGKYEFVPSQITVSIGETVTFSLVAETEFHTFTVDDLGIDESIESGETANYTHTFDKAGTYKLVCLVHETNGMVGAITVR